MSDEQKPKTQEEMDLELVKAAREQRIKELEAISRKGEEMENWVKVNFKFLDERILAKLEWDVFKAQKDPSYDVENKNLVHQHVAMLRAADGIRRMMEDEINKGVNARVELRAIAISTLPEGGRDDNANAT